MYLKSLHIKGLTSHADSLISFQPLTVVRAPNGGGKSSIEQAIELLFSGRSAATDDRGAGAKDLIRRGEDKAYITADIVADNDPRKLRCILSDKGRDVQAKKDDDPSYKGKDWIDWLTSKKDILSCLINGRYFVDMSPAKQKELLAGIVLPQSVVWDDWVEDAVNKAGLKVDWSLPPFQLIAWAHKVAYDERTIVNRQIKEWNEPEKPEPQSLNMEDIQVRLKERQEERDSLIAERAKMSSAIAQANEATRKNEEKMNRINAKLDADRQSLNSIAEKLLSDKKFKELQKIAGHADQAVKIDAEIALKTQQQKEKNEAIAKLEELTVCPQCPTCKQTITDEVLLAIQEPLAKAANDLRKEIDVLYKQRKDLGDIDGAKAQLDMHKQSASDMKLVEQSIHMLEHQLDQAQKDSVPAQELPDLAVLDPKIADLDQRLQKGNAALQQAMQYQAKVQAYDKSLAQRKTLDAKLALLEKLIEYFGPKGIQAKLLDEHVGGFERAMNKVLNKWGFDCRLQFEPYSFSIRFGPETEQFYNLKTVSASQRYRFACAFQVALATVTGFRFVVLDGADILDNCGRLNLYAALRETDLDQIIVLQTDDRRNVPDAKGTAFYMINLEVKDGIPTSMVERLF